MGRKRAAKIDIAIADVSWGPNCELAHKCCMSTLWPVWSGQMAGKSTDKVKHVYRMWECEDGGRCWDDSPLLGDDECHAAQDKQETCCFILLSKCRMCFIMSTNSHVEWVAPLFVRPSKWWNIIFTVPIPTPPFFLKRSKIKSPLKRIRHTSQLLYIQSVLIDSHQLMGWVKIST